MKIRKVLPILAALFFLAGCAMVTIYVTFPEEKIKKAAEDIEKMMESFNKSIFNYVCGFLTYTAFAQESSVSSDIKTDSPKIREAIKQKKFWADELALYKKEGYIGETNNYQVDIVNQPENPSLVNKIKEIIQKENQQRNIILEEIYKMNNVSPEQKQMFKEIFAKIKQKNAKPGEYIQDSNGTWIQKK